MQKCFIKERTFYNIQIADPHYIANLLLYSRTCFDNDRSSLSKSCVSVRRDGKASYSIVLAMLCPTKIKSGVELLSGKTSANTLTRSSANVSIDRSFSS